MVRHGQEAETDQINRCAPLLDDPPRLNLGLGADLLAQCILFDQVPRTVHSGTAKAFQYGERAEPAVLQGIANGAHLEIHPLERTFVYVVLMHSESLEHHRLAREMYTNTL